MEGRPQKKMEPLWRGQNGGQALPLLAALSGQWHAAGAAGYGRYDISAARLALAGPSPAT